MVKTYDPASYALAEHFLQDEPCRSDPVLYEKHCDDLARTIQQAVEDWFIVPDAGIVHLEPPTPDQEEYLQRIADATGKYDPNEIIGGPSAGKGQD